MIIYNLKVNGSKLFKIIVSVIVIIIVCIFIFTTYKIFNIARKEGSVASLNNTSFISDDNYTNVLKSVHENLDEYIGNKINFSGYVYRIYDFEDNQFVLARDMIINSDMQTVVVGFLCESNNIKKFSDGTWVAVTGNITKGNYHGEIPIIKVEKIEQINAPDDGYVYPPDENYLQTPEI